jgi:hypothetical protein
MSDEKRDLESVIRGLLDDLSDLTRRAELKRYKQAVKDAIDRVKALPGTATNDEIMAASVVPYPVPKNI